jgi:hypothetical protein
MRRSRLARDTFIAEQCQSRHLARFSRQKWLKRRASAGVCVCVSYLPIYDARPGYKSVSLVNVLAALQRTSHALPDYC